MFCILETAHDCDDLVQARGGIAVARRGKAKAGRARGLFAPPSKQVLDRTDSKLGKRRRTADYDFGDVIMPPMPGTKALAQLPVSPPCLFLVLVKFGLRLPLFATIYLHGNARCHQVHCQFGTCYKTGPLLNRGCFRNPDKHAGTTLH